MVKIKHYICPRDCGKSKKALELANEDPENTLLINTKGKMDRFQSQYGNRFKRVIIDEYISNYFILPQTKRRQLFTWMVREILPSLNLDDGELILISTPVNQYSVETFLLYKLRNQLPKDLVIRDTTNYTRNLLTLDKIYKDFTEIEECFLDPERVEVIVTDLGSTHKFTNEFLLTLGENQRKSFLGQLISE